MQRVLHKVGSPGYMAPELMMRPANESWVTLSYGHGEEASAGKGS